MPDTLPNVVVILADDLGSGDLGCYNPDSKVPTPRFDALAREGMRFTDAHSPSAVCTPTRYGLLTGRYAWRTSLKSGVLNGYSPCLIEPGRETLASLLAARGYDTMGVGKWHLGLGDEGRTDYSKPLRPGPITCGFDGYFGIPASLDMPPYVFVDGDGLVGAPVGTVKGSKQRRAGGGGFWRPGPIARGFRHDAVLPALTDAAVRYVEERGDEAKAPFFLYLALSAPHTPWMPLPPFAGKSGAGPYGDFVAQVDDSIGRVLDALERGGLAERTLVIVTSDNGAHWTPGDIRKYGHRANWSYRGQKADAWEGGHRVPFLVRWPGQVEAGTTSAQTVCLTDVFATVASVLGTEVSEGAGEDSWDMLPVLLGEQPEDTPLREATVHHSMNGTFAIRQGRWKLIEGLGSGGFSKPQRIEPVEGGPAGQLYDVLADIGEEKNLWLEEPEVVARLTALLDRYRTQGFSRPAAPGASGHLTLDQFKLVARRDCSNALATRVEHTVVVPRVLTREDIVLYCEHAIDAEKSAGPIGGIWFYFHLDPSDVGKGWTAGFAEWGPDGKASNASDVPARDYSRHELRIKLMPETPVGDTVVRLTERDRKRIYRELYALEETVDSDRELEALHKEICAKNHIESDELEKIMEEGLRRHW